MEFYGFLPQKLSISGRQWKMFAQTCDADFVAVISGGKASSSTANRWITCSTSNTKEDQDIDTPGYRYVVKIKA